MGFAASEDAPEPVLRNGILNSSNHNLGLLSRKHPLIQPGNIALIRYHPNLTHDPVKTIPGQACRVGRPLTDRMPPLKQTPAGRVKSNRNIVAAEIALDFATAGKRVIVFSENLGACSSVANTVNSIIETANIPLDETQAAMQEAILLDVGSPDAGFSPADKRATVHHGDLFPIERRLTESVFRAHGRTSDPDLGLSVIAATSTIAQGLNLPCDVVILAGTDRSTADDPSGNPRADLQPHEILNALGRAGRAAYAATGVAIVVPGYAIQVDTTSVRLHPQQAPLPIVFSAQDACDAILDPIAMLLDQIEIDCDTDPRTQAMTRRLTAITEDGNTGFDQVAKSSFGYHIRCAGNEDDADQWLEARRGALAAAAARLIDPPVLDWQQELAVRNGAPPEIIDCLNRALADAPMAATATTDWISWLLDTAVQSPRDLTLFVRKTSLDTVFNRAWKNHPDPAAATSPVVQAIKDMASMWCAGRTVVEIESYVLDFVHANEVDFTQPARRSTTAQRARRFAIRILPDIGFLCGLFALIVAHREIEDNSATQEVIPMIQRMIKAGDYDRHQAILRLEKNDLSRVRFFRSCEDLRPRFTAGSMDPIEAVQSDIRTGLAIQMFSAIDP